MFAPDTPDREYGGYPGPGVLTDISDAPEMNIPQPGHSPAVRHNTQMAGDTLPLGTPGTWSDTSNNSEEGPPKKIIRSDRPTKRSGHPR